MRSQMRNPSAQRSYDRSKLNFVGLIEFQGSFSYGLSLDLDAQWELQTTVFDLLHKAMKGYDAVFISEFIS
jgi:hypothetical protein